MFAVFCKSTPSPSSSARVVDGKLILSLPEAVTPVVWQMDLGHAKASALEVRHNADTQIYTLALKTPKGDNLEIANFEARAQAVDALMAASRALEQAHGQIRQGQSPANDGPVFVAPPPKAGAAGRGKLLPLFIGLVVLFVLYTIWSSLMPLPANISAASDGAASSAASGVPLSADAFLQQNR